MQGSVDKQAKSTSANQINKTKTFFLFFLFLLFGFLGFMLMSGLRDLFSTSAISSPPSNSGLIQQRNFLVLHVDNLENEEPQLVSIWAVFFYPADTANLTFKQLYPQGLDSDQDKILENQFHIGENGALDSKTTKILTQYEIDWSGYILMDTQSVLHITNWLQMGSIPDSILQAIQDSETVIQDSDEQRWFDQVCTQLENEDLQNLKHLPWNEIIPAHMHTNLYFDDLVTFWDYLARTDYPPHCEVLIP
jgi:hypothetical protein